MIRRASRAAWRAFVPRHGWIPFIATGIVLGVVIVLAWHEVRLAVVEALLH